MVRALVGILLLVWLLGVISHFAMGFVHLLIFAAGAREVWPVTEAHGRRTGRLVDPYGHQWEIGREL